MCDGLTCIYKLSGHFAAKLSIAELIGNFCDEIFQLPSCRATEPYMAYYRRHIVFVRHSNPDPSATVTPNINFSDVSHSSALI